MFPTFLDPRITIWKPVKNQFHGCWFSRGLSLDIFTSKGARDANGPRFSGES